MQTEVLTVPFHVKDCTLASLALGLKAQNLLELRDLLRVVPSSSIYYHFWGGRLRTSFEHREYHNDFAYFAHHSLHDDILAERLELLNPSDYKNLEELQCELIEIIDNRIDEKEFITYAKLENQFHFLSSKIVIFQTRYELQKPEDLLEVLPLLTRSSLFYHVIDATRRIHDKKDDFSTWLEAFGDPYQGLVNAFKKIDVYLLSLRDLREKLIITTCEYLAKR